MGDVVVLRDVFRLMVADATGHSAYAETAAGDLLNTDWAGSVADMGECGAGTTCCMDAAPLSDRTYHPSQG